MNHHLNLCVAQSPAELDGPAQRIRWLRHALNTLEQPVELLVLPELFACGYNIGTRLMDWAEPHNGSTAQAISTLAKKHQIAIHYSYSELDDGKVYNASQCFDDTGATIGRHRKLLLPPGFEGKYFWAGNRCELFRYKGFQIATLICYDAEFPETVRHVCDKAADLIVVPTALAQQWGVVAQHLIPTRAFESGCYIAYANQAGTEHGMNYYGGSCIVAPQGQVLARATDEPQFIFASLEQSQVSAARARLPYLIARHQLPL